MKGRRSRYHLKKRRPTYAGCLLDLVQCAPAPSFKRQSQETFLRHIRHLEIDFPAHSGIPNRKQAERHCLCLHQTFRSLRMVYTHFQSHSSRTEPQLHAHPPSAVSPSQVAAASRAVDRLGSSSSGSGLDSGSSTDPTCASPSSTSVGFAGCSRVSQHIS